MYFQFYLPPPHSTLDANASPFMWSSPLLPVGLEDVNDQQSTATYMEIHPYVYTPGCLSLGNTTNPQVFSHFVNQHLVYFHVFPVLPTSTSFHPWFQYPWMSVFGYYCQPTAIPTGMYLLCRSTFGLYPCISSPTYFHLILPLLPVPLDVSLWTPLPTNNNTRR